LESSLLSQVEATMAETGDNSMVASLDKFWSSWQSLSVDPSDTTLRADLLENSNNLTAAIQNRNAELNQMRLDQNLEIVQRVDEVNSIAKQVAQLNVEIMHVQGTNQQPNDLMDKRDMLLDRLSELTGARSDLQTNGMVTVSIGGHALVNGNVASQLVTSKTGTLATIAWDDSDTFSPQSGEITGLLDLRDNVLPGYQATLDKLAFNLVSEVNKLHNPTGVAGQDFFTPILTEGGAAGTIHVAPAMSTLSNIMGTATLPEDGSIAKAIAGLSTTSLGALGNTTFNQFYTQKAAELGLFTRQADGHANDRSIVIKALASQRESVEGVSLDEEAANLVQAQKAFQAATKLVTVCDEMLDRVINNMGLVGR
jgi:flagellar hook-associated protein 1